MLRDIELIIYLKMYLASILKMRGHKSMSQNQCKGGYQLMNSIHASGYIMYLM